MTSAAGEVLQSPPDRDLSFSRWRSNSSSPPPQHDHDPALVAQEPTIDFQSQFVKISPLVQHADLANSVHEDRHGNDSRTSDHKSAGPTEASESSSTGWEFPILSDDEFERDFGFGSNPRNGETVTGNASNNMGSNLRTVHFREHYSGRNPSQEEGGSCGSSEMSLQDLVERQEQGVLPGGMVWTTVLRSLTYILIWYLFSTGLTIYNKELLGKTSWKFPAPLLMNTIHFLMQAIVSSCVLRFCCPSMRPATQISWKDYFVRVVPTAVATASDIDLTNASLVFISISFETMCKSAAPVFLLLFAFAFKLEAPSFKLFGIIVIISSGVLLTGLESVSSSKAGERNFEVLGFVLVILAAIMAGFRWTVTQILLQKKEFGLNNPLSVMSHLAPVMAIFTAGFSLATEPLHELREPPYFDTYRNALRSSLLLLLGGSLAFFMVLAEYLLISQTSAVTLTVAGIVKEVVTIVVAVIFLGDQFTIWKALGLAVIMTGVSWFNWFKYQKLREHKHTDQVEFENIRVRYVPLTDKSKDGEEMHSV